MCFALQGIEEGSRDNSAAARSHPSVHVYCKAQGEYLCLFESACPGWS
jgi:hypothetical protein